MILGKWTTKQDIDDAVRDPVVKGLADAIRDPETPQEVRDYLTDVVTGLLTGELKFPRQRPKKKGLYWERYEIGSEVKVGEFRQDRFGGSRGCQAAAHLADNRMEMLGPVRYRQLYN